MPLQLWGWVGGQELHLPLRLSTACHFWAAQTGLALEKQPLSFLLSPFPASPRTLPSLGPTLPSLPGLGGGSFSSRLWQRGRFGPRRVCSGLALWTPREASVNPPICPRRAQPRK